MTLVEMRPQWFELHLSRLRRPVAYLNGQEG